jgi:hypothetical protein
MIGTSELIRLSTGAIIPQPDTSGCAHPIHFASQEDDGYGVFALPAYVEIGHVLIAHVAMFPRCSIENCDFNHRQTTR